LDSAASAKEQVGFLKQQNENQLHAAVINFSLRINPNYLFRIFQLKLLDYL